MNQSNWDFDMETMKFETYKGVPSLIISGTGIASIKDMDFISGVIEFDYHTSESGFAGIYFRRQPGANRTKELESEFFYLRAFKMDNPVASGAMQYAPISKGTNLWDLLHDYEANGEIKSDDWNHVKLVISSKQMKCYLNGKLALWIPELLGPPTSGLLAFEGKGIYANMNVHKGNTEGLPNSKGADLTMHDVRYLRDWMHSSSQSLPQNADVNVGMFPDSTTIWKPIVSGRGGLINLTSHISSPFIEGKRELIWLHTTLESDFKQIKRLNLGFSDDVWVYINGNLTYVDKNTYNKPISKQPNGRLHIDNTIIDLPLEKGENKIHIAVANNFFGWGLVARLNNTNGIIAKMTHDSN